VKYLLDTCVLSEMTKPRPSESVVRWLERAAEDALAVSVLTVGELEKGVRRLAAGERRRALERWLEEICRGYSERLVDVGAEVATEWGRIAAKAEGRGEPLPVIDALIGATAIVHRLTVVTRNTADIGRTGARVLDPWT
jgi:predicted nucleic acid-binding protein